MKIKLEGVRLSFPDIFEAGEYEGKKSFGATFLIEPGSKNDKTVRAALTAAATEAFKGKGPALLAAAMAAGNQKCCYWSGDLKEYDGYAGQMALSAKRPEKDGRPGVYDKDKTPLVAADGKPYAGCYVNATVDFWPQDNKWGKSVRCTLLGVQFAADGDSFGGASGASEPDDFDDMSDGADAADLA